MSSYPGSRPQNKRIVHPHLPPSDIIDARQLADHGISAEDISRRAPWAVRYRCLDGRDVWLGSDLEELLPEDVQ